MPVREISLQNVRSYELFSAVFDSGVTLVMGRNGSGKTSLLESIYYLAQGTSFRGRDRDMIAHSSSRADILLVLDDGQRRRASLQDNSDSTVKKSFTIGDKSSLRMPAKSRIPVVLFEPDELRLLSSSPERRRRFFDGILARLYPQYATVLTRYQRTLLQRNELLKNRPSTEQKSWENQLFTWDIKFAELADTVTAMRREFVVLSNSRLSDIYSGVADAKHHVTVSYLSNVNPDNYQQKLLDRLHNTRLDDADRGFTSSGPHRDDFLLQLDGHAAAEVASRGEMRTIMLAYKLLEVELQQEAYDLSPLILMDDVFSELDVQREQQLMHALAGYQTIITATDLRDELKINASIINL